jgi:hypothetical protein
MIGFSAGLTTSSTVRAPIRLLRAAIENANSRKTMIVRWEFPLQVWKEQVLFEIDWLV